MRPPVHALDVEIQDSYWAMNRAHHGLNKALALISHAKWKDCQKAARDAKEKVEDAVEIGKIPMNRLAAELRGVAQDIHIPSDRKERMVHIAQKANIMIRSANKAVNAPHQEKMRMALMEAIRITKEIEDDILRFYAKLHTKAHTKIHTKKKAYGMSRKRTLRHRR